MSTTASAISRQDEEDEIEYAQTPQTLLCALEANSSLLQPGQLWSRLVALDNLDANFGSIDAANLPERAKTLRTQLEAANADLYQSVRSTIVRTGQPHALLRWLHDPASRIKSTPAPGLGFDCRDEFVSGILPLREPDEPNPRQSPEMVPYQPTPVRHILDLIAAATIAENDAFVDLGSGLGHVPLLVSLITGARSVGIEVEAAYVASAQECAQSLHLHRVRFLPQDAREADLSSGTVFYLYSPFSGSILSHVLNALQRESASRPIKVCSLGPCTRTLARESWLKASTPPDPSRITVFDSQ